MDTDRPSKRVRRDDGSSQTPPVQTSTQVDSGTAPSPATFHTVDSTVSPPAANPVPVDSGTPPNHDATPALGAPPRAVTPPRDATSGPVKRQNTTPPSNKRSGARHFDSALHNQDDLNVEVAKETAGYWIGPMDPKMFLDEFLPSDPDIDERPTFDQESFAKVVAAASQAEVTDVDERPAFDQEGSPKVVAAASQTEVADIDERPAFDQKGFSKVVAAASQGEVKMYESFNAAIGPFAPKLKFTKTGSKKDMLNGEIAVDISVYSDNVADTEKTNFAYLEMSVEFKCKATMDPFVDPDCKVGEGDVGKEGNVGEEGKPPSNANSKKKGENASKKKSEKQEENGKYSFEKDTEKGLFNRGQMASYVSALSAAQFRTHTFSVFIAGKWARLIRWDRNGAIVTKQFLYAEVDHLVEFFWRYSQFPHDDPRRGHDPTVRRLPDDYEPSPEEKEARTRLEAANRPYHCEFRTMVIPDRETEKEHEFLISYPLAYVLTSPIGRVTRTMLAFDIAAKRMVFAKDYWRPHDPHSEKEGDIYKILHDNQVRNIARFWKGNDIRNHKTVTDTKLSEEWVYSHTDMASLRHYRISLQDIGRPLHHFTNVLELINVLADAMEGHEDARAKAQILHRDISVGNIIIDENGRGLLIDWDLCLNQGNKANLLARRPSRTGTWQFMSVACLKDPKRTQDHLDDRESAFHVLIWNLLRSTLHNQITKLSNLMQMFDEVMPTGDVGGLHKNAFLVTGVRDLKFDNKLLHDLVQELSKPFAARYVEHPSPEKVEKLKKFGLYDTIPHFQYQKLEEPTWLVDTLRKYANKPGWPLDDHLPLHPLFAPSVPERKRVKRQSAIAKRDSQGSIPPENSRKRSRTTMVPEGQRQEQREENQAEEMDLGGDTQ